MTTTESPWSLAERYLEELLEENEENARITKRKRRNKLKRAKLNTARNDDVILNALYSDASDKV